MKWFSRFPVEDLRFQSSILRAKFDYVGGVWGLRKNFKIVISQAWRRWEDYVKTGQA